jgi:hypothetical protein
VLIAALQFILNGIDSVFGGVTMMGIWFAGALLAAFGRRRIERYFERQRRLRRDDKRA